MLRRSHCGGWSRRRGGSRDSSVLRLGNGFGDQPSGPANHDGNLRHHGLADSIRLSLIFLWLAGTLANTELRMSKAFPSHVIMSGRKV